MHHISRFVVKIVMGGRGVATLTDPDFLQALDFDIQVSILVACFQSLELTSLILQLPSDYVFERLKATQRVDRLWSGHIVNHIC